MHDFFIFRGELISRGYNIGKLQYHRVTVLDMPLYVTNQTLPGRELLKLFLARESLI
jgi:hypothetical protein